MAAQSRETKVLRIGIIQDGKIVQERLVKAGESVTVGESAKNMFVFPKTHLPGEFTLFHASNKGYALHFTEEMKGKISSGGAVVALQKLSKDPSVQKQGNVFVLPLTQQDRGKLSIDAITILFQFVSPPPVKAVKPIQAMDFRPRMYEEDDPVFLGFLAIWSALAVVLMIYVWNTEPQELKLEDLDERFARIIIPPKVEKPPPAEAPKEDLGAKPKEEPKADAPKEEESIAKGPVDKVQEAANKEKLKQDVVNNSKLLQKIIGTTGESKGGVVENLWSNEDMGLGDVDAALKDAGGTTTDAGEALRSGKGKGGVADIEDMGGAGGGTAQVAAGPSFKINVAAGEGSADMIGGDSGKVSETVKRNAGQLRYCYETRLKQVPSLQGRVEIGWSMTGGKPEGVYIVSNSTGDKELADCIVNKIKRWSFPSDAEGDITWPFTFQASKG